MKYLGDSLVGLRLKEYPDRIILYGSADPTLLHSDFPNQPVLTYLNGVTKSIWASNYGWQAYAWGSGWSWSDFSEAYMAERSALPVFGNVVRFAGKKNEMIIYPKAVLRNTISRFYSKIGGTGYIDEVKRSFRENEFEIHLNGKDFSYVNVPFITSGELAFKILSDTLRKMIIGPDAPPIVFDSVKFVNRTIHSNTTDSLLKPMMHRSDNFFAEQSLLMVSNELIGVMNDEKIIDTLLKTDFKDFPQKPRWADGSGLSRYNLFTPQDFVFILNKMKDEFGMERIKEIFATGGEGTISSYYKADSGYIYAKTGTLSGVVALSGFLYTQSNKLLIFSTIVNNHNGSATEVRRAVEKFIQTIRNKY